MSQTKLSYEDYCVGCGVYVAEGRQVCPECMAAAILKSKQKEEEKRNKQFRRMVVQGRR